MRAYAGVVNSNPAAIAREGSAAVGDFGLMQDCRTEAEALAAVEQK